MGSRGFAVVVASMFAVGLAAADRAPVPRRLAYLVVGHGEINDPASVPAASKSKVTERRTSAMVQLLQMLNYRVERLGNELAKNVPADADVVLLLAPVAPLRTAELAALGRYLDRGGALLLALDPQSDPALGSLGARLGIKRARGRLVDDKAFLPKAGDKSDQRIVITTQFGSHPSTSSLQKLGNKGLLLLDCGALELIPTPKADQTVTLRSADSTWLEVDDNLTFDTKTEKRQRWPVGVAIELPTKARALVFADADLFADAIVQNSTKQSKVVLISGPLLEDSMRWLVRDSIQTGAPVDPN